MQRVNIYGFPHKGIRYGLGKLSFKIGSLILDDAEELNACKEIANDLSELLSLHLHAEEDYVTPPLEAKVPGSTDHNHEDHIKMEQMEHEMKEAVDTLLATPNQMNLNLAYDSVNLFIREYYRHMSEEENEINEMIWAHFSDAEILGWQGQILSKLTPDQFFKWFKYIIPALSPLEQSIMLGGFKQNAPKEVFAATIKRLKPYVSAKQYEYIGSL